MYRKGLYIFVLLLLVMPVCSFQRASALDTDLEPGYDRTVEIQIESLSPIHSSRQIDTVLLDILFGNEFLGNDTWSFYYGLTLTNASGLIDYHYPHRDSSAFGLGPVALIRYEPFRWEQLSVAIDLSGGLIFYDKDFPAGGDFYNFMWRLGPKWIYKFNDRGSLSIGYQWMHVSNGQHGHNPAYDAEGISVGLRFGF